MSTVNKVILIGNIGQDPEMKTTQNGFTYVRMSLATSEHWTDKSTGEKKSNTTWHNLKVYDKLATFCTNYVRKGSKIYVEGNIRNSEYEKDGITQRYSEVIVRNISLLSPKDTYEHKDNSQEGFYEPTAIGINDEVPF